MGTQNDPSVTLTVNNNKHYHFYFVSFVNPLFTALFVSAPSSARNFKSTAQNETSITLQWNKVNDYISFILQFNGREIDIAAPDGDGPVTYTVSSLTAGTTYTFALFSVFENVRSSGVSITAVTVIIYHATEVWLIFQEQIVMGR